MGGERGRLGLIGLVFALWNTSCGPADFRDYRAVDKLQMGVGGVQSGPTVCVAARNGLTLTRKNPTVVLPQVPLHKSKAHHGKRIPRGASCPSSYVIPFRV